MGSIGYIVHTGNIPPISQRQRRGGHVILKIEVLVAYPIIKLSFLPKTCYLLVVCAVILLVSLWRNHVLRDMFISRSEICWSTSFSFREIIKI
jgi:hypothetical protein